ncbi:MAG: copper chaperone PCu(A)C [Rhodospirillales bacterium]|nr:copper chaperone PCu(A)C [Rhodospirillales bacterium]
MKISKLSMLPAIIFVLVAFAFTAPTAQAHEVTFGNITLVHPFARASAGPAKMGAAFIGLHNNGSTADRLVSVSVSADVAKKAEIHTHIMEGDVAKMRRVDGGVEVPANGMVMMQPGGLHIMLMRLKAPLEEGESFMLTVTFEKAGEMTIEIPILDVDAGMEMDGGMMNHSTMDMD